jgi:hypothetical protein
MGNTGSGAAPRTHFDYLAGAHGLFAIWPRWHDIPEGWAPISTRPRSGWAGRSCDGLITWSTGTTRQTPPGGGPLPRRRRGWRSAGTTATGGAGATAGARVRRPRRGHRRGPDLGRADAATGGDAMLRLVNLAVSAVRITGTCPRPPTPRTSYRRKDHPISVASTPTRRTGCPNARHHPAADAARGHTEILTGGWAPTGQTYAWPPPSVGAAQSRTPQREVIMPCKNVKVERIEHVGIIRMNRPKCSGALNAGLARDLNGLRRA